MTVGFGYLLFDVIDDGLVSQKDIWKCTLLFKFLVLVEDCIQRLRPVVGDYLVSVFNVGFFKFPSSCIIFDVVVNVVHVVVLEINVRPDLVANISFVE